LNWTLSTNGSGYLPGRIASNICRSGSEGGIPAWRENFQGGF